MQDGLAMVHQFPPLHSSADRVDLDRDFQNEKDWGETNLCAKITIADTYPSATRHMRYAKKDLAKNGHAEVNIIVQVFTGAW